MKPLALLLLLPSLACANPTAPTPTTEVSAAVLSDPRYDAAFFASFVNGQKRESTVVYIDHVDDKKQPIPALTLEQAREAAASLLVALGLPADVRSTQGANAGAMLRGVTIHFQATPDQTRIGGFVHAWVPGVAFINYQAATADVCGGLIKTVVRHELMHALGFGHTADEHELMFPEARYCDVLPSAREVFHFGVVYL